MPMLSTVETLYDDHIILYPYPHPFIATGVDNNGANPINSFNNTESSLAQSESSLTVVEYLTQSESSLAVVEYLPISVLEVWSESSLA